jgi:hypothetical protein
MKFPNRDGLIKLGEFDPHGGAFDGSNTPGITLIADWAKRTDFRRLISENTILGHLYDQKRRRALSGDDSAGKLRIGEFGDITRRSLA